MSLSAKVTLRHYRCSIVPLQVTLFTLFMIMPCDRVDGGF